MINVSLTFQNISLTMGWFCAVRSRESGSYVKKTIFKESMKCSLALLINFKDIKIKYAPNILVEVERKTYHHLELLCSLASHNVLSPGYKVRDKRAWAEVVRCLHMVELQGLLMFVKCVSPDLHCRCHAKVIKEKKCGIKPRLFESSKTAETTERK